VPFLGHPGEKFLGKKASTAQKSAVAMPAGQEDEVFCFCFSSLVEKVFAAARSGQGRAVFGAAKRTLYREDRGDRIERGGKDPSFISIPWRTTVSHDQ
jgi:hypothetical protein